MMAHGTVLAVFSYLNYYSGCYVGSILRVRMKQTANQSLLLQSL